MKENCRMGQGQLEEEQLQDRKQIQVLAEGKTQTSFETDKK